MPHYEYDTENADRDLTSLVTVLTDTPDADFPTLCYVKLYLGDGVKDLDGTGGDFLLIIKTGGVIFDGGAQVKTVGAGVERLFWQSVPFSVKANEEVIVQVESPNIDDDDVDVTAYLFGDGAEVEGRHFKFVSNDSSPAMELENSSTGKGLTIETLSGVGALIHSTLNSGMEIQTDAAYSAGLSVTGTDSDGIGLYVDGGLVGIFGTGGNTALELEGVAYGIYAYASSGTAVAAAGSSADAALSGTHTIEDGSGNNIVFDSNIEQIDTNSAAATALLAMCNATAVSTVNDGSATTTSFITSLTEASDDHYNGCVLVFTSGALLGQSRRISDYAGATKTVTLESALTEAPANSVSFIILGRIES